MAFTLAVTTDVSMGRTRQKFVMQVSKQQAGFHVNPKSDLEELVCALNKDQNNPSDAVLAVCGCSSRSVASLMGAAQVVREGEHAGDPAQLRDTGHVPPLRRHRLRLAALQDPPGTRHGVVEMASGCLGPACTGVTPALKKCWFWCLD